MVLLFLFLGLFFSTEKRLLYRMKVLLTTIPLYFRTIGYQTWVVLRRNLYHDEKEHARSKVYIYIIAYIEHV